MRTPRSPCGCGLSVIFIRATIFRKLSWVASGAQHRVTGPTRAENAVATMRSVRRSCRTAAAWTPIVGMSRVLAKPGIGASARIVVDTGLVFGGDVAMGLCESLEIGAEEIRQGEPPHQEGDCNSARQCRCGGQVDANPSKARQLHAWATQVKACDQAQDIDFDAFDPAELEPGEAMQIDLKSGTAVCSPGIEAIPEVTADCVRRQCKTKLRYSTQDRGNETVAVRARPDSVVARL